eukprot:m.342394 g.342394  ORF g.342394 m.342394 type:complete len:1011 (-) comp21337_c0_seq1:33-3065(-)
MDPIAEDGRNEHDSKNNDEVMDNALTPEAELLRETVDDDSDSDNEDKSSVEEISRRMTLSLGLDKNKHAENPAVIHQGYLLKRGGKYKTWKQRWFIVTPTNIGYYTRKGGRIKGGILVESFIRVRKAKPSECSKPKVFVIESIERSYYCCPSGKDNVDEWITKIEAIFVKGTIILHSFPGVQTDCYAPRLLLQDADVPYKDIPDADSFVIQMNNNSNTDDEGPGMMPAPEPPVLTHGDHIAVATTLPIMQLLGNRYGYEPKDTLSKALCLEIASAALNIEHQIKFALTANRHTLENLMTSVIPRWLDVVTGQLTYNKNPGFSYFFGNEPMYCDFVVAQVLGSIKYCFADRVEVPAKMQNWFDFLKHRPRINRFLQETMHIPFHDENMRYSTLSGTKRKSILLTVARGDAAGVAVAMLLHLAEVDAEIMQVSASENAYDDYSFDSTQEFPSLESNYNSPLSPQGYGDVFRSMSSILRVLANSVDKVSAFYPSGAVSRASVDSALDFAQSRLLPAVARVTYAALGLREENDDDIKAGMSMLQDGPKSVLSILETHHLHGDFVLGDRISLGDMAICAALKCLSVNRGAWNYVQLSQTLRSYLARVLEEAKSCPQLIKFIDFISTCTRNKWNKDDGSVRICSVVDPDLARVRSSKEKMTQKLTDCHQEMSLHAQADLYHRFTRLLTSTPTSNNDENVFSFLQFNILAEGLSASPDVNPPFKTDQKNCFGGFDYVENPDVCLDFKRRKWRIVEEILRHDADIITLQECDHFFDFFQPALEAFEYQGVFYPKTPSPCIAMGYYSDGIAIFFKRCKWRMKEKPEFGSFYGQSGTQSSQGYLMTMLQHVKTGYPLLVATTHLKSGEQPEHEVLRTLHVRQLLTKIHQKIDSYTNKPAVVLAGDFNTDMFLPKKGHECINTVLDWQNPNFKNAIKRTKRRQEYTLWKIKNGQEYKYWIDYIFHDATKLMCTAVLDHVAAESMSLSRLPNFSYPSDHLAQWAQLKFIPHKNKDMDSDAKT